ncbi:MAG: 30S ribosomal protein S13 [Planctomycetota bacterium]
MPRVIGVDIPANKRIEVSLRYIFGLGPENSKTILKVCGIDPSKRSKDLTEDELSRIAAEIDKDYVVEGQLRRQISQNIGRLKEIRCYKGLRHLKGLPVHGQRTKTNARTRKGPKRTIAGKKSVKELK